MVFMTRTDQLIKSMKPRPEIRAPIATEIFLPNHSGDHSKGHTGTPINDSDIANKAYVDSQNFWQRVGTILSPKTSGDGVQIGGQVTGYETFDFTVKSTTGGMIFQRISDVEPAFVLLKNNTYGGMVRSMPTVDGIGISGLGGSYSMKSFPNAGRTLFGAALTATSAASTIHLYEDNSTTGTANGLTIENDGTGDATLQFLLTGVKRWMMGIDNSDSDKLKIGSGISDLGSATAIVIDTSNNTTMNNVIVANKIDTNASYLYGIGGTATVIDWGNAYLQDYNSYLSADWSGRKLYGSDGTTEVLDWNSSPPTFAAGASGTFTTADAKTVSVSGGIITSIV